MKQRITYVRSHDDSFHPSQLEVHQNSMTIRCLAAAKEHRLTVGLNELPREVHMHASHQDRRD